MDADRTVDEKSMASRDRLQQGLHLDVSDHQKRSFLDTRRGEHGDLAPHQIYPYVFIKTINHALVFLPEPRHLADCGGNSDSTEYPSCGTAPRLEAARMVTKGSLGKPLFAAYPFPDGKRSGIHIPGDVRRHRGGPDEVARLR